MHAFISHVREVGDHIKYTLKKVFISQNNVGEVRDKQDYMTTYITGIECSQWLPCYLIQIRSICNSKK